jgi:ATP:cob(I)alamin adenosyltransferase
MANVYTRTGDKGTTGLFGGNRVSKDDIRVECYGTMDEANSMIGYASTLVSDNEVRMHLKKIQSKIFVVGSELASDEKSIEKLSEKISGVDVLEIEETTDFYLNIIGEQKSFVIPGVNQSSSVLHVARTIVRRGERLITSLNRDNKVNEYLMKYVNRLSDCIFTLARYEEHRCIAEQIKNRVIERINMISNKLDLNKAKKMAEYAEEKAREIKVPMVFSVVDNGGNTILAHRMDDALLGSIDISLNKAYTSSALKMATHELNGLSQPGQPLYGIENSNDGRIILFGGGYPIYSNGKILGGIGVSGGSVEEDKTVAEYVLKRIKEMD